MVGIDSRTFEGLLSALEKSWLKEKDKQRFNSASIAITENSNYFSGFFGSSTHLLDISSEQAATIMAVSNKDPVIEKIVTLISGNFTPDPIVIKFLIDHSKRTVKDIEYCVIDREEKEIFSCKNISDLMPFYKPEIGAMEKIKFWSPRPNKIPYNPAKPISDQLRSAAKLGSETHFTSNTKTLYGSSVLSGKHIYFGGVYSCFDRRLSLHSEMVSCLSAIMDGNTNISNLGLISTKFVDSCPQCCGSCRQFLMEIQQKTKIPIKVHSFSFDEKNVFETKLDDYLPHSWNPDI